MTPDEPYRYAFDVPDEARVVTVTSPRPFTTEEVRKWCDDIDALFVRP